MANTKSFKCPICKRLINPDEPLVIEGIAQVKGSYKTSINNFFDEGGVWEPHDSYDENVICPTCGEPIDIQKFR